jgi:uncharacterized protein
MRLEHRFARHQGLWDEIHSALDSDDLAHDALHIERVYAWAVRLADAEDADADLAGAAALVHDLINIPKESTARSQASTLSAGAAAEPLAIAGYGEREVAQIVDAVRCCSWSSKLAPPSAIGAALQDADRLDAIGAIGVARTFMTAQAMRLRGAPLTLYERNDPLAKQRQANDRQFALDHFSVKLLRLADGMHTALARKEASRRQQMMVALLEQLERELNGSAPV